MAKRGIGNVAAALMMQRPTDSRGHKRISEALRNLSIITEDLNRACGARRSPYRLRKLSLLRMKHGILGRSRQYRSHAAVAAVTCFLTWSFTSSSTKSEAKAGSESSPPPVNPVDPDPVVPGEEQAQALLQRSEGLLNPVDSAPYERFISAQAWLMESSFLPDDAKPIIDVREGEVRTFAAAQLGEMLRDVTTEAEQATPDALARQLSLARDLQWILEIAHQVQALVPDVDHAAAEAREVADDLESLATFLEDEERAIGRDLLAAPGTPTTVISNVNSLGDVTHLQVLRRQLIEDLIARSTEALDHQLSDPALNPGVAEERLYRIAIRLDRLRTH